MSTARLPDRHIDAVERREAADEARAYTSRGSLPWLYDIDDGPTSESDEDERWAAFCVGMALDGLLVRRPR